MQNTDHYSVLGVLPEAEAVVITAAFRALAQRYHPDRWKGSPEVAHERMSRINAAYDVLSDPNRRAQYDVSRDKRARSGLEETEASAEPFTDALAAFADRWSLACEIYPDLELLRAKLQRTSASLALAFTILLLEEQRFVQRIDLATALESAFLARYFSSNPALVAYAKKLISLRQREPLLLLNRLIEVMGIDDPDALIRHVNSKHGFESLWREYEREERLRPQLRSLTALVLASSDYFSAKELAQKLGYQVKEVSSGFLQPREVLVRGLSDYMRRHPNRAAFVTWVKDELCR